MTSSNERVSIERTLTQGDFNKFAKLSGDHNPIHVDPEFSAKTRFGRTVSHGLFLNSILRGLLDQLVPGGRQISQKLRFPAPTYADEPMRFVVEVQSGALVSLVFLPSGSPCPRSVMSQASGTLCVSLRNSRFPIIAQRDLSMREAPNSLIREHGEAAAIEAAMRADATYSSQELVWPAPFCRTAKYVETDRPSVGLGG